MIPFKSKTLVRKFSYGELIKECLTQGWRLPTLEEAKEIETSSDCFFIQPKTEIFDDRLSSVYYPNSNAIGLINKKFMLDTVVVVLPKVCVSCDYCDMCVIKKFACNTYGKDPKTWGCTEFKRRVK